MRKALVVSHKDNLHTQNNAGVTSEDLIVKDRILTLLAQVLLPDETADFLQEMIAGRFELEQCNDEEDGRG